MKLTLNNLCFFAVFLVYSERKQCIDIISAWCQSVKTIFIPLFGINIGLLILICIEMNHRSKAGKRTTHIVPISATILWQQSRSQEQILVQGFLIAVYTWRQSEGGVLLFFVKLNSFERTWYNIALREFARYEFIVAWTKK